MTNPTAHSSPQALAELLSRAERAFAEQRIDDCIHALQQSVQLAPTNAHLHFGLARALLGRGDRVGARRALAQTLALAADHVDARIALARLCCLDAPEQALALLAGVSARARAQPAAREALALARLDAHAPGIDDDPWVALLDSSPAHFLQAAAEAGEAAPESARQCLERVAMMRPDRAAALFALGKLHFAGGRTYEARQCFEDALTLAPDLDAAAWGAMQSIPLPAADDAAVEALAADWDARLDRFEALAPTLRDAADIDALLLGPTPFYRHYLEELPHAAQRRYGRLMGELAGRRFPQLLAPRRARPRARSRVRVAFASAFLRRHTVWKLFRRFVLDLDRSRFEVAAVNLGAVQDAASAELDQAQDFRIDIGGGSLAEAAQALDRADLDALIWLDIGMDPLVQALSPLRLARFQAQLWGHPPSSGLAHIDAFISAESMERADADSHYHEPLHRLPGIGVCYDPPDLAPDCDWDIPWRDQADAVRVVLLQSLPKLGPVHDRLLAAIAAAAPTARFTLVPDPQPANRDRLAARMRACFDAHGLDFDRHVRLLGGLSEARFLGLIASADLNLDSLGWSGGNTTLEALAFGLPTLTLPGKAMRTRHSSGMLTQLGVDDELVVRSEAEFVTRAVELIADPGRRQGLRRRILTGADRLFRDRRPLRALEDLLERSCR